VHVNYFQRPPVHRLEIVGTEGTLRWDNADGILHLYKTPASFGSYSNQLPAPIVETFSPPEGFERNQLFLAQTRHFIEIVRGESEPICTLEDGVMALRLARAAYESQKTGQVVKLKN
jgi:predicted dehydrogenase